MRVLREYADRGRSLALAFYLQDAQLRVQLRQQKNGEWLVLHLDEEALDKALALAARFDAHGDDPAVQAALQKASQHGTPPPDLLWQPDLPRQPTAQQPPPVANRLRSLAPWTITFLGISILVAIGTRLGDDAALVSKLSIASFELDEKMVRHDGLADLGRGQLWRLITPIFLHFGFLHLVFNLLWLRDLGTLIEVVHRRSFLPLFVLGTGVLSNLAQYWVDGSPLFGGLSGVIYALLGYLWLRGRFDPSFRFQLPKATVVLMLGWFVVCYTGVVGNVANTAHAAGLVLGMALGYLLSGDLRRRFAS